MNNILMTLGNRIKNCRQEKGITQKKLASLAGIERSQLSKIESGNVDPQFSTVIRISEALNQNLGELMTIRKETHPFVKWAGGKTQLLDKLISLMPTEYNDYYEPFVGGGALLFKVNPSHPHINDMNDELLSAFRCFTDPEKYKLLENKLKEYEAYHSEENYLFIRAFDRNDDWMETAGDVERAARMIYLNKACFNGLYRVNSKGYFNVPSGKKTKVKCFEESNFDAISSYFKESKPEITHVDFEEAVKNAKRGDFVYFDPPYDTWDEKGSFTSYDKNGFGKEDQKRLANCFKELDKKGVKVMLSNHNTRFINQLYDGYEINVVPAKRMINSKGSGRGNVEEVIIRNYKDE